MMAKAARCHVLVFSVGFCPFLAAASLVVDPAGSGDYSEIQAALDAAVDGDTILVRAGVYEIAAPLEFDRGEGARATGGPSKDLVCIAKAGPRETIVRGGILCCVVVSCIFVWC